MLLFVFTQPSFSAGSTDGGSSKTDYEKAVKLIKQAKKYEQKGKEDKAQTRYEKPKISNKIK